MSDATFVFRGLNNRPPPFVDAIVDVSIANPSAIPMWYVWPLYLDDRAELEPLLASSVEVSELKGHGVVRVARFLGNGSSQVVRIAPGVTVVVKRLPITLVGPPPSSELTLTVLSANAIHIGAEPAEEWFQVDLLSRSNADVTYEAGAIVASQDTPGARPLPVQLRGKKTQTIRVRLEPR